MRDDIMKNSKNNLVVSPDGRCSKIKSTSQSSRSSDLAIIDKRRDEANKSEVMNVIGEVNGKDCIIVDDVADTAGTLCNAADALKEQGASKVYAYIVHPVLSGNAIEKISQSKLDQLVVTDTIPLSEEAQNCKKIRIVTMAPTLAEAIRRVNNEESISAMFL